MLGRRRPFLLFRSGPRRRAWRFSFPPPTPGSWRLTPIIRVFSPALVYDPDVTRYVRDALQLDAPTIQSADPRQPAFAAEALEKLRANCSVEPQLRDAIAQEMKQSVTGTSWPLCRQQANRRATRPRPTRTIVALLPGSLTWLSSRRGASNCLGVLAMARYRTGDRRGDAGSVGACSVSWGASET